MPKRKKSFLFTFLIIIFFILNCNTSVEKPEKDIQEGWIENHTLRVRVIGAPKQNENIIESRKTQAKKSAILSAQYKIKEIIRIFQAEKYSLILDESEYDAIDRAVKKFESLIFNGTVIRIKFDNEQNCEIIYQVHQENLKQAFKKEY